MDFTELYRKIATIDKSPLDESMVAECPHSDMNAEPQKQQDAVNMNVSITGQGANGIRDLMNILRNIDDAVEQKSDDDFPKISHDHLPQHKDNEILVIGQPGEMHGDSDDYEIDDYDSDSDSESDEYEIDFEDESADEPQFDMDNDSMIVGDNEEEELEDSYQNSAPNSSDKKTMAIASVVGIGNDLLSKGGNAVAKNDGGSNPYTQRAVSESLLRNLHSLYNEVKNR
jgi:hypothetical protein